MKAVAKVKILEITLSVIGPGEDGYPSSGMPQIVNAASRAFEDCASSDQLVISVRIRGARMGRIGRYRPIAARPGQADLTMAGTGCR